MEYQRGERVRILGKPEWGPGYIQSACRNGKVNVRFKNVGRKTLDLHYAKLMKVALRNDLWMEQRACRWRGRQVLS
jgi:hypothetical protein